MKKFLEEQDSASQPPEPRGEQTPGQADELNLEEESGETLLDETMPEELNAEEEEELEWDGSETELVADESAAEYEEQHTGIKLKYSLKSKEIFYALVKMQYTPTRIAFSSIAVILSALMAVVFFVKLNETGDSNFGLLSVTCFILLLVVAGMPAATMKLRAKELADGKEIRMKIYPDEIEMGLAENRWQIALDGTSERTVFKNLLILSVSGKNMVILPLRCVEPTVLPEVQAMIFAGTEPKN